MFDEMKLTKNEMWLLKTNLSEKGKHHTENYVLRPSEKADCSNTKLLKLKISSIKI